MKLWLSFMLILIGIGQANGTWYIGNTHVHTSTGSGDSDAEAQTVVNWYVKHAYDFLVVTDHNSLTKVGRDMVSPKKDFLIIQGEEITQWTKREGKDVGVHVNGIGLTKEISTSSASHPVRILQDNIDAILAQGGIAQINHPNYYYSLTAKDFLMTRGARLFELYNESAESLNEGGRYHSGLETLWDQVLSRGQLIYGVAADDAHDFVDYDSNPAQRNLPGTGWIVVEAEKLTQDNILKSIKTGKFYASNGVNLKTLKYSETGIEIEVLGRPLTDYWIRFSGKNGKTLKSVTGTKASYTYTGKELYVRATITSSRNRKAWTQPQFLKIYL